MQIIYFILAIILLLAFIWKPLVITIGLALLVYLIVYVVKSYKSHPKRVVTGIISFICLVCFIFLFKSCIDKQQVNSYRNYELQKAVAIIQEHNVSADASPSIFYNFVNDSLNRCKFIDYNLLFTNFVNLDRSDEDCKYELYSGSAYAGKVLTFRNKYTYNNQKLLEEFESVVRKISLDFGSPHYDKYNDSFSIRTTKWEFDKLHILLYGDQSSVVATGSISIFDPRVLNSER